MIWCYNFKVLLNVYINLRNNTMKNVMFLLELYTKNQFIWKIKLRKEKSKDKKEKYRDQQQQNSNSSIIRQTEQTK